MYNDPLIALNIPPSKPHNVLLHLRHFQYLLVTHPMQYDHLRNPRTVAAVLKYHYKETMSEQKVRIYRLHLKLIFKLYLYMIG